MLHLSFELDGFLHVKLEELEEAFFHVLHNSVWCKRELWFVRRMWKKVEAHFVQIHSGRWPCVNFLEDVDLLQNINHRHFGESQSELFSFPLGNVRPERNIHGWRFLVLRRHHQQLTQTWNTKCHVHVTTTSEMECVQCHLSGRLTNRLQLMINMDQITVGKRCVPERQQFQLARLALLETPCSFGRWALRISRFLEHSSYDWKCAVGRSTPFFLRWSQSLDSN